MEELGPVFIGMLISGGIGALIGRNRKIGAGWAFILGAILGLIGWIIAACIQKNNVTKFDDVRKDDNWK